MKCLTCLHCMIDFGSPSYGDQTPGSPGSWNCLKGKWTIGGYDERKEVRDAFAIGETCDKWESDERTKLPWSPA